MASFRDTIPSELVTHTVALCGDKGEAWINGLQTTISELEREWSIKVGEPFPAIEYNFVAAANTNDGLDVVVKIAPPFETVEIHSEAMWLKTLNGAGAVKLLAENRSRRAILLERATPGKNLVELFSGNEAGAIEPAIMVLREIIRTDRLPIKDIFYLDDWFKEFWGALATAFPREYSSKALDLYSRLSNSSVPRHYLHGDFHPANLVSASRKPYLAIDPKGLIGPVGYDIAVFLNNLHWWQEKKPDVKDRLQFAVDRFANAFSIDPIELRQWAFVQMVIGAWWNFDEMPAFYNNEVAKADVWDV